VTALCLLAGLSAGPASWASPDKQALEQRLTPEQMHETGLDTLTPAQLARLNELLRQEPSPEPAIARERTGAERGGTSYLGLDEKPITTRLKGSVSHWEPGTEFALENGQVWKVLKGHMKLRKPLDAPEIVLVPGFAGRWFLQVDEDLPKARVYRID
jgi:hypothetical protein